MRAVLVFVSVPLVVARPPSELLSDEEAAREFGIVRLSRPKAELPHMRLAASKLPDAFNWCDVDGRSFCTVMRNQHIPQYCGSCWAFASATALADRVKIARGGRGQDLIPSVQHILNCAGAGSCHGGMAWSVYQWIAKISNATGTGVALESSNPYMACSFNSHEGFCPHVNWTCTPENVARTCPGFAKHCSALSRHPNITVSDFGQIFYADYPSWPDKTDIQADMMKEIHARGPIACSVDADPLRTYTKGIATDPGALRDHVVSVTGWGTDAQLGRYWHVRNSWGEYWGELGFARVQFGALKIEEDCSWAVPGAYTSDDDGDTGIHCFEDASNCKVENAADSALV